MASELVVDQRGAVEELTEKGLELLEIAAHDDIRGVTEDMDKVTGKYDDLKTTVREKLCQLNLTWQTVATSVRSLYVYLGHCLCVCLCLSFSFILSVLHLSEASLVIALYNETMRPCHFSESEFR